MITYVDTSTLIKLLIVEVGTPEAAAIWDEPDTLVTAAVFRGAVAGLEVLWSQLSVVEVDEDLMRLAGDLATTHGLRGYDAVHLAAAHLVGAEVFSSADRRLCGAASTSGFHVANPVDAASPQIEASPAVDMSDDPTPPATKDSGMLGIAVPATSQLINGTGDGYRASGFTIQELTAAYKDWMSTDGWIFDAEYSHLDPYLSEEGPHVGYFTQSIYVKPTTPPTTIAVIIGNFDGKPGNKRDLRVHLTQTPDDELPRRSLQLSWAGHTA